MNNATTQIDPGVQSWLDTYYIKLSPEALFDLTRFLQPELNIQVWSLQHYLNLPADAENALASLLRARTGCLTATLESDGTGTALPDFSSECRCSACDQKFLDLRRRIAELQDRNTQLEAAYLAVSAGENTVITPEPDTPTNQQDAAASELQVPTEAAVVPRNNKNQQGKFRVKHTQR